MNENKKDPMEVETAVDALNDALRLQWRSALAYTRRSAIERHFDSEALVRWLIDAETETIDALQDVIPATGQAGRSEALEHRLEHVIMRKQEQVDALIRASGGPSRG